MFGIDFSEILVIFGIALVVLGPERLPKLAATIGRWLGRARSMARQFREQLEQEANRLQHETKGLHDSVDLKDLNAQRPSYSPPGYGSSDQGPPPSQAAAASPPSGSTPAPPAAAQPEAQPPPQASSARAGASQGAAAEFGLHNAGAPEPPPSHEPYSPGSGATPHATPPERPVAVEADER